MIAVDYSTAALVFAFVSIIALVVSSAFRKPGVCTISALMLLVSVLVWMSVTPSASDVRDTSDCPPCRCEGG